MIRYEIVNHVRNASMLKLHKKYTSTTSSAGGGATIGISGGLGSDLLII